MNRIGIQLLNSIYDLNMPVNMRISNCAVAVLPEQLISDNLVKKALEL